ncbi:MAG: hypothetical protein DRO18_04210 [Thermoprotei archaeon]|nr:MAG: hypothetical protein DRO18_04210 [Thermoprotei archaeon]
MSLQSIKVELPPHNYFIYYLIKTSLGLIAAYTATQVSFNLREGYVELKGIVPQYFAKGLKELVSDVVGNVYGLRVNLTAGDVRRLSARRSGYVEGIKRGCIKRFAVDVDCILKSYAEWVNADPNLAIKELGRALSRFDNGYPQDPGSFSMLNPFLPEFVEGVRAFGATAGIRGSVLPGTALFRNMKIGIHTVFLGLLALRASRVFFDVNTGYTIHVLPSDYALINMDIRKLLGRDGEYVDIIGRLKALKNVTSDIVVLTYVSLIQSIDQEVEVFEILAGRNRWEIIGYGSRALHPLPRFISKLKGMGNRGEIALGKLRELIEKALAGNKTEVAETVVRSIYQALSGVIGVGNACYSIARATYANDDEERHRILRLRHMDVYTICEALEDTLEELGV